MGRRVCYNKGDRRGRMTPAHRTQKEPVCPRLLIVIPAYNEEENIVRVVDDLTRRFPQYDYVVVNDGSRDKTAALCRAHGYRLIDLPVNLGLGGAFQTGCAMRPTTVTTARCSWTPTASTGPNTSPRCWKNWRTGRTLSSAAAF